MSRIETRTARRWWGDLGQLDTAELAGFPNVRLLIATLARPSQPARARRRARTARASAAG